MESRIATSTVQDAAEKQDFIPSAVVKEKNRVLQQRLDLEEKMRQERHSRLQAAPHPPRNRAFGDSSDAGDVALGNSKSTSAGSYSGAAPLTLTEYRRELEHDNSGGEALRRQAYTNAHLNPDDVRFYVAKSRIKAFQREAPRPRPSAEDVPSSTPVHKFHDTAVTSSMGEPVKPSSKEWTRAALLRMEANLRVLQRIERRETEEAALRGSSSEVDSPARRKSRSALRRPRMTMTQVGTSSAQLAAPLRDVATLANRVVRRDLMGEGSFDVSTTPVPRSPRRTRSPIRTLQGGGPVHPAAEASGDSDLKREFRFQPSFMYSSSKPAHTSSIHTRSEDLGLSWRTSSLRKPLANSWSSRSQGIDVRVTYPARDSRMEEVSPLSAHRESDRAWADLLERHGVPAPKDMGISAVGQWPKTVRGASNGKADVEVSPLTPSPRLKASPSHRWEGENEGGIPAVAPAEIRPVQQRPSPLLEGFRMPSTVLTRPDLFEGNF